MLKEFRALLPYLARYRLAYAFGSLCILLSIGLKLLIPAYLGDSIDSLRSINEARSTLGAGGRETLFRLVLESVAVIVATALVVAVVRTGSRLTILGTSRRVVHDMRAAVFSHLLRLAPSFYSRNPSGQILSRCINDMQNVQGLMGPVIMYLAETVTLFAIGLVMMLRIDPTLTLLGILPFPPFLIVARRLAVRIQEGSRMAQNSLAEVGAKVDESLSGQMVIKTLNLQAFDRSRFADHAREYRRLNLEVTRSRAVLIPMMMALTSLSTIIVLSVGGPKVVRGEATLGDLVAMILYLQMLAGPTRTLGFVISSLRRGASALGRIREIGETRAAITGPPQAGDADALASFRGDVSVEDLTVDFPAPAQVPHLSGSLPEGAAAGGANGARRVLENVSLRVPSGTTLGIVGHTGSGKTTLARILARQLEVDPGHVFFDGVDVNDLPLAPLRRRIGYVPQDAFLFSISLADNVALGKPDADRASIDLAVEDAQLATDLPQLPEALDTIVGERGVNLSGGQRQRAALARVLLLQPRVLILDDTLSAVDTHTAEAILEVLRPFAAKRTTIMVAHRLSTVRHAEQIIVLEEGRIAERGTHAELIALGGRYARLFARQERIDRARSGLEAFDPDGEEVS